MTWQDVVDEAIKKNITENELFQLIELAPEIVGKGFTSSELIMLIKGINETLDSIEMADEQNNFEDAEGEVVNYEPFTSLFH